MAEYIEREALRKLMYEEAFEKDSESVELVRKLQSPRWIPVTEQLPKDSERVITVGPKGGIQICRFSASTPMLHWHFWTAGNARIATVTHWMPLPEPPLEET